VGGREYTDESRLNDDVAASRFKRRLCCDVDRIPSVECLSDGRSGANQPPEMIVEKRELGAVTPTSGKIVDSWPVKHHARCTTSV